VINGLKLAIFDHSGVLSDDRRPVYEANMILLDKYNIDRITFQEWLDGSKASAGDLVLSLGADVSKEEIDAQYANTYNEIVTGENPIRPTMYPGVPQFLGFLKHHKDFNLAIVSSHPKANLERELEEYGNLGFMDEISGDPMPKTERLQAICKQFSVNPEESFFVEDTIYGLRSGHQAGVHCFGVTTGYHSRERLEAEGTAVKVVDSLGEIMDCV
jgi:phosphoglycolate phosphatase